MVFNIPIRVSFIKMNFLLRYCYTFPVQQDLLHNYFSNLKYLIEFYRQNIVTKMFVIVRSWLTISDYQI